MARALTTKSVEAVKPEQNRREIPDPALAGLYLVVQPSGAKSWALRYRFAGRPKKLTLGKWPIMGVADARAAASEAIEALEHGNDPSAAKKKAKAARIEAQLSERDKVKTLLEQYAKRHLSKLRSGSEVKRRLETEFLPRYGDHDIHEVTKRDILELLEKIADSGRITTANRMRLYLSGFFNWCLERDAIPISPVQGVKPVAKEKSRDRVLNDDEIRWFWKACERAGYPWRQAGQTLLLTGQRLNEVLGMTDDELHGDAWHLSAQRTKNGREHLVPLSQAARDVLSSVERIESPSRLLFTTTGRTPICGHFKARNRLSRFMAEIAEAETGEAIEIPHWTFHDLRRTAATGMARLGIPVRVTEAVLNHVSGTGGGIVAVYQRHDFADEKRKALEAWARFVLVLVEGGADNVVQIAEGGR
ncbi:phage integrase family protein [Ruegeria lacuscaerulensis ITI-1157]|nr:phage integrase family protein [Ruegeria lacuscaerulensis ITI-1157]SHI96342.1 Site-specific recombinase XerD [Ruegeria lacuscaerulensis ITI-1157]